jgi:hypothetical protein
MDQDGSRSGLDLRQASGADAMNDAKDRAIIALCDIIDDLRKRIEQLEMLLALQRGKE